MDKSQSSMRAVCDEKEQVGWPAGFYRRFVLNIDDG